MAAKNATFKRLIKVGIALSAEKDLDTLMEMILLEAKDLAHADGGTVYRRTKEDKLQFEIIRNDTLGMARGGTTGEQIDIPPVEMYLEDGTPNESQIVSYAALSGETLNVKDAYDSSEFDFTGTKRFDEGTGYRTTSVLTVPLKNNKDRVIGVLQLLNARDSDTGEVIEFTDEVQPLVEALASQAAVALDNASLIEQLEHLMESFITLMASAIDAKSPYTGGHCQRVPQLTEMLTKAVCESDAPPFRDFDLDETEWRELHIAGWLHDCGKVTTPEYVVDKATKLETISDRIHEIRTRFEVVKRERVIEYQNKLLAGEGDPDQLKAELDEQLASLDDDFEFIARCNLGGEFMAQELVDRVHQIAEIEWTRTLDDRLGVSQAELKRRSKEPARPVPCKEKLLADRVDHLIEHDVPVHSADPDNPYGFKVEVPEYKYHRGELHNLCISRGTLSDEERFKINDHIVQTIVMLESLPLPDHLKRIPEIAGGHHEKMDGTGYPRKLEGGDMSIPARVMAIADVFEALTAADRPYKPPKTLSDSIRIMSFMVKDDHLDPELFRLFLESGVYKDYAMQFLEPTQIDEVNIKDYLS
ncbi:MAG: HD domain-containing phosphohydrolase [Xanthomonadales bacterium]|nr:HD domain-containing phosphohydrolase [Xanthomonadales bacterium]